MPNEELTVTREVSGGRYDEEGNPVMIEIRSPVCCVTVYEVTRHHGGPEEGNWWYNHYHPVCSVPLIKPGSVEEVEEIRAFLKPRFEDEGDINSVLGGKEHDFIAEWEEGDNETKERPYYC